MTFFGVGVFLGVALEELSFYAALVCSPRATMNELVRRDLIFYVTV